MGERPVPIIRRFECRYCAVQSVLGNLRQGSRELKTVPRGDDDEATLIADRNAVRAASSWKTERCSAFG